MKKASFLLLTVMSLFILSCESSNENLNEPIDNPEIVDDFKLLTVNGGGKIFEIGNNTGETTAVGQIVTQHNLIILPSICHIDSKIYALESDASHPNILFIYDQVTRQTSTVQLVLPLSLASMNLPIISLKYNGSELIAIVSEEMPNNSHPSKIVSINLQNFEITDLEINIFQRSITCAELINNTLYIGTHADGLLKVDLSDKSITEIRENGVRIYETKLTKINNSKMALMKFYPQYVNGVKPFEYNIDTNTFSDKSAGNDYAVGNISGGSVFYNREYLNIVYRTDFKFGILKTNYENNEIKFVELDNSVVTANAIIVDILD